MSANYTAIAHADATAAAGAFPLSLALPALAGLQPGDLIVMVAMLQGSYTPGNGWGIDMPTSITLSDTLEGMTAIVPTPIAAPTTQGSNAPHLQEFSALWFWAVGNTGSDTLTLHAAPTLSQPLYTNAFFSAVVYRSTTTPFEGNFIGQIGAPNNFSFANGALNSLSHLVDHVTVDISGFMTLPALLVGVVTPGSGAPAGYTGRGSGIMVDTLDTADDFATLTVATPTGTLWLMGFPIPPPVNTGARVGTFIGSWTSGTGGGTP